MVPGSQGAEHQSPDGFLAHSGEKVVEKVKLYADIAFIVWWAVFSTYKAIKEMMNHE